MAVAVLTKSRLGFEVAMIATFAIGGREVLLCTGIAPSSEATVCGALSVVGLLTWIVSRIRKAMGGSQDQPVVLSSAGKDEPEERTFEFLRKGTYWGATLIVCGGMLYLMCLLLPQKLPASGPPPVRRRPVIEATPAIVEAKPVKVKFPPLKLQGLVQNGLKSNAVINGTTISLGESVGDLRLTAVGEEEVTVEMAGQTKVLSFSPSP